MLQREIGGILTDWLLLSFQSDWLTATAAGSGTETDECGLTEEDMLDERSEGWMDEPESVCAAVPVTELTFKT